ncbi:transglycosylase SLT domain-containing protein [Streptomyces tubbatahanensis]|uniref:Transglycosylase SLT domain-containing protein n=1 Tax=Streptomyces tubbatahanensis TaxID=2923272 RepID=A0ABY3XQ90_9ACTN|nr:transglycosylase SLT domain-containing protein [Streptomyces tubbatahanensis]UNS96574.1 transglycosylase SLT domain-containing protein [Streptomyces tubbatahanensis]
MPSISSLSPGNLSPRARKMTTVGIGTAGAAALALTVLPGTADHGDASQATAARKVNAENVAFSSHSSVLPEQGKDIAAAQHSLIDVPEGAQQVRSVKDATTTAKSFTTTDEAAEAIRAGAKERAAKAEAQKKAEAERAAKETANRSEQRAAKPTYPNNLDGWIREALAIMDKHNIPGSYEGIHRNVIRESGGDPRAINNWDINAQNGVPSKGLLQVIKPTFDAYHVEGTSWDQYDPVANIVTACNYAADRYGSMDNVNSAY